MVSLLHNHNFAEAYQIGKADPGKGKMDITNDAIRFSTNVLGLEENSAHEGSQVNAFRHALWQAIITKELGANTAMKVGNAHEENPNLIDNIKDFNKVQFKTLAATDTACDLSNNRIGRDIGSTVQSYVRDDDITMITLDYYNKEGLWVGIKQSNGNYVIVKVKLLDKQYKAASCRVNILDLNGFTPEQGEK